jgi:hypothetical protein
MLDKVRTGFSRWASSTYSSKQLVQRRKITGEQATVLNEREQAYTEHGNGTEARAHSVSVKMDLAAAWSYHVDSYTNAGKTEPVVREWKQSHLATTAPHAASAGVSTDTSNTAAVSAPAQQRPSTQVEGSECKRSGERPAHHEDSPGSDDDGGDDSPGGGPSGGDNTPRRTLWRCTSRVRSGGRKKNGSSKNTRRCDAWNPISRLRCKQCRAMNPDLQANKGREVSDEATTEESSTEAQVDSSSDSSVDSAALVQTSDDAHLCYAILPVDHWVHPWSLPAIKARTSFALEVVRVLWELWSKPEGQTKQQRADLQVQFQHHMQTKWAQVGVYAWHCS